MINGTVEGNGIAVLGSTTINGTVHGNAVAVMGNLRLGPKARVDGNAVSVGGDVIKDPGATVGGEIVPVYFGMDTSSPEASMVWKHGILRGRPFFFAPHMHVFWLFNLCIVAVYLFLTLVFPKGITKCADTLQNRPGITILTGFLAMLAMPVLFILLCVTIIGIPVAFVILPLGVLACLTFGKAAVYSLVGRSVAGKAVQPAVALLVGVVVLFVLYFVPLVGLAVLCLVNFLGFACALTTLFTSRSVPTAATPAAAIVVPAAAEGATATPIVPPGATTDIPPAMPLAEPPPAVLMAPPTLAPQPISLSEVTLPKAGFWIRMMALLIDVILVAIVTHASDWFLPVLALYGALLWHLRGATVGGIIFGLKVVRIDGRPSEWVTMAVRALACFFSLIVAGLGFIWIAFDPQKQAWHDKIAGTVVVRVPKGISLV